VWTLISCDYSVALPAAWIAELMVSGFRKCQAVLPVITLGRLWALSISTKLSTDSHLTQSMGLRPWHVTQSTVEAVASIGRRCEPTLQ
jgi:hypothetical protein